MKRKYLYLLLIILVTVPALALAKDMTHHKKDGLCETLVVEDGKVIDKTVYPCS